MGGHFIKQFRSCLACYRFALYIGLVLGVAGYAAMRAVTFNVLIEGVSMQPALHEGECVLGARFGILGTDISRGDIISFIPPVDSDGDMYVKRVIGLPGETVAIKEGKVYIDGRLLEEPYLDAGLAADDGPYCFEVPYGHCLVMGDNRGCSYDSREWDDPYVDFGSILMKAYFVYRPLRQARYLY